MRIGWITGACGVVLATSVGYVVGQIVSATQQQTALRVSYVDAAMPPDADLPEIASPAAAATATDARADESAVYFPSQLADFPAAQSDAVHAAGVIEATGGEETPRRGPEPAALPDSPDATPLTSSAEELRLRQIVESELSDIPEQEREIWIDALRGLPAEDALGILRLWKKFGGGPAGGLAEFPSFDPDEQPSESNTILVPDPLPEEPLFSDSVRGLTAVDALRQARQVILTNLLNSETIGYRRREVLFTEISLTQQQPAPPQVRIDQSQGGVLDTPNGLDFNIVGAGLFVVTDGEQQFYTRCGRFSRGDEGRLVLQTSRGPLALHPEVKIPEDALIAVNNQGKIVAFRADDARDEIGLIELARFADAARLEPVGDALFVPTPASGAPQLFIPSEEVGYAVVQQMQLERANVSVEEERRRLKQLDEWLELLQHAGP